MCGIFGVHGLENPSLDRARFIACSKKLRHRGPDWSGCFVGKEGVLVHERLAIVGVDTGAQPLVSQDGKLVLAVNGEIYNFLALRAQFSDYTFKTHSDCEVILPLYKKYDTETCNLLDGMFSFVLLDESVTPTRIIAARDPIGITTLYQGWSSKRPGAVFFASELKALTDECDKIISFPPGHVYDSRDKSTKRYFQPSWWDGDSDGPNSSIPINRADLTLIRETLEAAVRKRLMSEVPYGVLLSGGLDSSLIAAIAARETEKVALAQYELRKKRFQEAQSGPSSPKNNGEVAEEGTRLHFPVLHEI
jgi:asparagine synthase (glutamine-hydrolysing)